MSKGSLKTVQSDRSSDWVIQFALLLNAILTAMFAFNHLGGVFGRLTGNPNDDVVIKIVAAIATVIAFDGAFHAWASISNRQGLSNEQIATAKVAKQASMAGSLAASAGQFVLGQSSVVLSPSVVFVVALIATASVGVILIMHMFWWDKFKDESFTATELAHKADQSAALQKNRQTQEKEAADLSLEHETSKHAVQMEEIRAENELALTRLSAEQQLKKDLVMLEIDHERQVAAQTKELLTQNVNRDAAAIAKVKSERLLGRFMASQNVSTDEMAASPIPSDWPGQAKQTMAADGNSAGVRLERRDAPKIQQRTVKDVMTGINAPHCVLVENVNGSWIPQPSEHSYLVTFEDLRDEINEKRSGWWAIMNRKEEIVVQRDLTFGPCDRVMILGLGDDEMYFPKG